tara:strand:- start:42 stop:488 length:447 start_codon:yes stop_codon:yes gene_type:complete
MSGYVRAVNFVKNFLKGGKQKTTGQTINPFERTKMRSDRAAKIGELKVATQDVKGAKAKLDQTLFEAKHNMPFTFDKKGRRITKSSGGRVSRKFGGGITTKKSNVKKIQEVFGPKKNKKLSTKQMKIAKLAGNPNKIDAADFAKLRKK